MHIFEALAARGVLHSCTVSERGKVLRLSASLGNQLGYDETELGPCDSARILTSESLATLQKVLISPPADEKLQSLELILIRRGGSLYPVLASGLVEWRSGEPAQLQLALMPIGAISHRLNQFKSANEVMSRMLLSAKVAYWCIEFAEAVDMSQSPDEIVRQVFENRSYWRLCNRAMADVYEMPADVDFSQQPVQLYWPRSPANEEFVRRLVEANFCVDGALSVDRRHDGSPAYVENGVRAAIHNGFLLRMWGSIRDVSQELRLQHDAHQRIDALRRVFDAVPDAVVVIDETLQPRWRNSVFENTFGITQAATIVQALMASTLPERIWHTLDLTDLQGRVRAFNVHCSRVLVEDSVAWKVAVLRASEQGGQVSGELHP